MVGVTSNHPAFKETIDGMRKERLKINTSYAGAQNKISDHPSSQWKKKDFIPQFQPSNKAKSYPLAVAILLVPDGQKHF